jgi:hypothetical protein
MIIERDGKTWQVTVTRGYVCVHVPLHDCEGTQRTIDFAYSGYMLMPSKPLYHWTARDYVKDARNVAKVVMGDLEWSARHSK